MSDAPAPPAPLSPNPPASGEEAWDELSPDGLTLIRWAVTQGRMSHEIITPQLHDAATGALILRLDSSFDGQIRWAADARFVLYLRHYSRAGAASVEIDRKEHRFRFLDAGVTPGPWHTLERVSREVEARFTPTADEPRPVPKPRGKDLFVLACLTIAGIALYAAYARLRI